MIRAPRSLRLRMVVLFGLVVVGIAAFMATFVPGQIEDQLRAATERRAITLANVIANAVGPAIEFDDAEHAQTTLALLESSSDARWGVVEADGVELAAWHRERMPLGLSRNATQVRVQFRHDLLIVTAPVERRAGGRATVQLGFSLAGLEAERDEAQTTVAAASALVLGAGAAVCFLLATILVRPIRRLTATAHKIARGEAPPAIPASEGSDEVSQMASAFSMMLERLNQVNSQLVHASRHAGMAEVATGVLHNVGNVLTSVNVAVDLISERLSSTPIERLKSGVQLLDTARTSGDVARLEAAVKYLNALAERLGKDHTAMTEEVATLRRHVAHVVNAVLTQNRYARTVSIVEMVSLGSLIDEAIELGCPEPAAKGITVIRTVDRDATINIDRHRALQIVVNLITNARDAVLAVTGPRTIEVRAIKIDDEVRLEVEDSGVGFGSQDGERIFQAGFTTKPKGHGYGLHSSAIAAQQLGGTLRCSSPGVGKGASFSLRIPVIDADQKAAA